MAAARRERPVSSLRLTFRPSRLALVLIVLASALAALAITHSGLSEPPFALAIWAALSGYALFLNFDSPLWLTWAVTLSGLYLFAVGGVYI